MLECERHVMTVVLFVMLVAMVTTTTADEERLTKKFGMIKIFESCFGLENTKTYMAKKHSACETCRQIPVRPLSHNNQASVSKVTFSNSPISLQGFDFSAFFNAQTSGNTKYVPVPVFIRQKRENNHHLKYFTEDRVRTLAEKMEAKLSNATCVMRQFGFMDDNNELLYENMINEIRGKTNLDYELKDDLIEAVEDCRDLATCMPTRKMSVPLTPALLRFKIFKKCNMKKKLAACMKKDLRAKRDQFDLNGLDGSIDMDDDDKMLAIIWSHSVTDHYDF